MRVVDQGGDPGIYLRSWSLVKMGTTANQKRLFFNLRKVKGQIQALDEGDLRPTGCQHRDQARRDRGRRRLDEPAPRRRRFAQRSARADGEASGEWQDWLVTTAPARKSAWPRTRRRTTAASCFARRWTSSTTRTPHLRGAPARRRPITLEDLSTEFGVSRERVRQIEVRAFEKVQKAVKKGARELERPRAEIAASA